MANHVSHAALPYPVKGARFTVQVPYLDDDGDPTDPTTPDTEISKDGGAFADCAEEATVVSGSNGLGYITLSGAETDCSMAALACKAASGPKATLVTLFPRVLPVLYSGTAQQGAAGSIRLATGVPAIDGLLEGAIVKTTGGTGGGGTGGANNQARVITGFDTNRDATVVPNWETTPDNTTTYEVLLTPECALRVANLQLWKGSAPAALADTDKVQVSVAHDQLSLALASALATVDTVVDAIKAVTDNLPDSGALDDLATLEGRLTAARAGFVDNLNIGGLVASQAEAQAIQNNTRCVRVVPTVIERPDSGTQTFRIELLLYDDVGNMEAPDSAPTLALVNQAGTDLSSRLDAAAGTLVSTGRYRWIYTASVGDALEQLVWAFSVIEAGNTRIYGNASLIVDTTAVDFTASDRADLAAVKAVTDLLPDGGALSDLAAIVADTDELQQDWENGGRLDLLIDAIKAVTDQLPDGGALSTLLGNVAAVLDDTGTNGVVLSAATRDAIATSLLDLADAIETGWPLRKTLRVIASAACGKLSGADTTTNTFRSITDGKDRITATVDADGNRTAVTLDGD